MEEGRKSVEGREWERRQRRNEGGRRDRCSKRDSEKACRNQEERREKDVRAKD